MEKLIFDWRGHIEPPRLVDLSMAELEENFVSNFTESTTRQPIFDAFKKYNADLIEMVGTPLFQWIDGSFVTKKLNPNDIDVVSFFNYVDFFNHKELFESRFKKWGVQDFYPKVDAYATIFFPERHEAHGFYRSDYAYWFDLFSRTRKNRAGQIYSKGFIQLKF